MKSVKRVIDICMVFTGIAVLLICVLASCGEVTEPAYLINLAPGSAGYEGDGEVRGLYNGKYLIQHIKKNAVQEKDKAGNVRIFHDEDWYAVDSNSRIIKIASSANSIPQNVDTFMLSNGLPAVGSAYPEAINVIKGLTNGETYNVYFYGEPVNGQRISRRSDAIDVAAATWNRNVVINLRNLHPGESINVWEFNGSDTQNRTDVFNDNNFALVLVDTPLYWTELPMSLIGQRNASILVEGYDYDIEVKMTDDRRVAGSVAPIEREGQKYFILTGHKNFRCYITVISK